VRAERKKVREGAGRGGEKAAMVPREWPGRGPEATA